MDLFDMKVFLDNLVDTFSIVLDLDCTIINANPIRRVSGTGVYKENFYESNWQNSYAIKVIEEKKPYIVIDTTDRTWSKVGENLNYYSVVLHPISVDNIVKGVIVLASLNKRQQHMIKEKSNELLDYLEKISQLISAKFEQEILLNKFTFVNNQLSTVFESVTDGLILYSKEDKVLQINDRAKSILQYNNTIVYEKLLTKIFEVGDYVIDNKENVEKQIYLNVTGQNYSIMIKAILSYNDDLNSSIIIINDFKEIQKIITQNDHEINSYALDSIVGDNTAIKKLKEKINIIANNASNILLLGESGTGKELFARAIHSSSCRRKNPFIAINCAAIPEMLLESELFGYEDGSFTGAKKGGKIGKFLLADRGTLFLDEIGDMPLYLQTKLLRVLDDKKVDRVGSSKLMNVDIHIIAATNKNLEEMVEKKEFRQDLFYRLNVIPFYIPPLRERREDILLLTDYFINKYNKRFSKNIIGINPEVSDILLKYSWPGNVRELENNIEYMVSFESDKYISIKNIPYKLRKFYFKEPAVTSNNESYNEAEPEGTLKELLSIREKEIINSIASRYEQPLTLDNIKEICYKLHISIASFYRKYK
jgi:transcriptional regulator with PAS, ATPase and Fis domain